MSKKRYNPNSYPKSVRDRVSIDYTDKLNDYEQTWLASFNESEYGANPELLSEITGQPVTQKEKRRKWRQIKKYQRDTMSQPIPLQFFDQEFDGSEPKSEDSFVLDQIINHEDILIELLDNHAKVKGKKGKKDE